MATETHEGTAAEGHGSAGLPQFDFQWWPGQIAWFLIIFFAVMAFMRFVAVPKVSGTIEAREGKIAGDIAEARRMKDEADGQAAGAAGDAQDGQPAPAAADAAQARAGAQKVAAEARAKAQAEIAARLAEEEAKLAATGAEAEARIAQARDAAVTTVPGI